MYPLIARTILAAALGLAAVDSAYIKEVEAWRAKHEADYRRDWASIDGLYFLKPGENRAGSARTNDIVLSSSVPSSIGSFFLNGETVRFEPRAGAGVVSMNEPLSAPIEMKSDGGKEPADEIIVGSARVVVHKSGDRLAIRVRDEHGEMARSFLGFKWFPIDERYRVTGRFIKDPSPREVKVPNTMGDIDTYTTEGVVEFTLGGKTMRMRPMTTRPKRLYFVFRDATSGHETYAAARFLYADLRDDGTTVLDFNQAYNPPCAFNPYTTCPIPPRENRLKVKILAGERSYPHEPKARAR